ncbi:hypothetical protein BCR43DRAFT_117231 [Syncephalastrum racemosum]|uniref:Uncharacterized protein n=1 Tax=Syncephalastrum racemosum TaxID=13706 RepID=A0A1X2GZB3_SYNRA|nr:hypothetical protein BCR43DRAFT_117231 [Syncephalastrum racemosum]
MARKNSRSVTFPLWISSVGWPKTFSAQINPGGSCSAIYRLQDHYSVSRSWPLPRAPSPSQYRSVVYSISTKN